MKKFILLFRCCFRIDSSLKTNKGNCNKNLNAALFYLPDGDGVEFK